MTQVNGWFVVGDAGVDILGPFATRAEARAMVTAIEYGRVEQMGYDDPTVPDCRGDIYATREPQEMTLRNVLRGRG